MLCFLLEREEKGRVLATSINKLISKYLFRKQGRFEVLAIGEYKKGRAQC